MEAERVKELTCKSPDSREDMIADLKSQVLRGVYKIRAEHVAKKIIEHGIHVLSALEKGSCNYI